MKKIRPFTLEEQLSLSQWPATDDLGVYMIARILILAQKDWHLSDIALVFLLEEDQVLQVIQLFNQYGLSPFIPSHEKTAKKWQGPRFDVIASILQQSSHADLILGILSQK